LNGGERICAGLAIRLLSKTPPQLIILDEPTNHLDLRSIKAIEEALSKYQGAMLVISHDSHFLDNIAITKRILLT
jgi:ATPase subunit of ABC transporter with duplicated ATPase domains